MKFYATLLSAFFVLFTLSCGEGTATADSEAEAPTEMTEETTDLSDLGDFQVQLEDLVAYYLEIKNALVASDLAAASAAAANYGNALDEIDAGQLTGLDRSDWDRLRMDLAEHGKSIAGATDLEAARKQFSLVSPALVETLKRFQANDEELYVQYCPMAFDNAGASWVSSEEEIRNPYFGDKMLTCGKVEETLVAN